MFSARVRGWQERGQEGFLFSSILHFPLQGSVASSAPATFSKPTSRSSFHLAGTHAALQNPRASSLPVSRGIRRQCKPCESIVSAAGCHDSNPAVRPRTVIDGAAQLVFEVGQSSWFLRRCNNGCSGLLRRPFARSVPPVPLAVRHPCSCRVWVSTPRCQLRTHPPRTLLHDECKRLQR